MTVLPCPTCQKPVAAEAPNLPAAFPFCSERCRLIDLGRWLGEEFKIPVRIEDTEESEEGEPPLP